MYDVLIIGGGLSGLTCAALLAKRGLEVCVLEAQYKPGGSCGIFKRDDVVFEQGTSMLFGFGEEGFNSHRFVFDSIEEEIEIIKHDSLYAINFNGKRIIFYEDLDKFINQLGDIFTSEREALKKFYYDITKLYKKVIVEGKTYTTPDTLKIQTGMKQLLKHPISYIKFLSYLNSNAKDMLGKYFSDPEIFNFFDKLTSTYSYTTVEETPAVLAAVMFIDNHFGGGYCVAGSTLNLVGKLEKVIEENNGKLIYNKEVSTIIVEKNKAIAVKCIDDDIIYAGNIVYSGTVWNLYNKLLKDVAKKEEVDWANSLKPTYSSLVFFALVKDQVIPKNTLPIEMLVGDITKIDEKEVTVYIPSIEDESLCREGYHTIIAIGPSFESWPDGRVGGYNNKNYRDKKDKEKDRIIKIIEKRFPGFSENLNYCELSTPSTLERYLMKNKGAVAGPKQELGQHMLKRLHAKSNIKSLYFCGESTVMGTGAPAVTVSGVAAANVILRDKGIDEYEYKNYMKRYVSIISGPYKVENIRIGRTIDEDRLAKMALKCQFCENPPCHRVCPKNIPVRDINRRLAIGNFFGAKRIIGDMKVGNCNNCNEKKCLSVCIRRKFDKSVEIDNIINKLTTI